MKADARALQDQLAVLWKDARWLENAHRYYADMVMGLMNSVELELDTESYRPPICVPPKVCWLPWAELRDRLDRLAAVSLEFRSGLEKAIVEAERRGIEGIAFRPSQLPDFPSTKEPKQPALEKSASRR